MKLNHSGKLKFWGVALFLLLALIIFLPAFLEYHSGKNDLLHLWHDQSRLVAQIIVRSGENMLRFDEEVFQERRKRLREDSYTLRQIDSTATDKKQVLRFARERIGGIVLYFDRNGNLRKPRNKRIGHHYLDENLLRHLRELIRALPRDSVVQLIDPQKYSFRIPPGVLIRRAGNKGFVFIFYRPLLMNKMVRFHRLKRWLEQMIQAPSIFYIQLRRGERVLVQSKKEGLPPLETLSARQLENMGHFKWQIVEVQGHQIFDYWQRAPEGLWVRVGISAQSLRHLQTSLVQRLILNSLLLLIIGFIVLRFFISRQNLFFLQEKLNQIETYTGSILANMSEGIIAVNEQGQIELLNKWAEENLGLRKGDKPAAVAHLPFEESVKEKILNFREFDDAALEWQGRYLLLSGRVIRFRGQEGAEQTHRLFLIIVRDFTSQRELERMRSRRSKLMAMGELASRVAHEIRNPLNGIAMLAQRLQKEFKPTESPDEFRQMTGAIRQETQRINKIVQSFLMYAKTPTLEFQRLDLAQYLKELEPVLQAHGPNPLHFETTPGLYVNIDPDQMKQVLINLVKNAMEASQADQPVFVRLKKEGRTALIFIEDQGKGIRSEHKERIFDLYFSTKTRGSGLGLSIVEKIVESHGGKVRVESPYEKEGESVQGTRFIIELELDEREEKTS
jgi:signal transduction histidine kinase